MGFLLTEAMMSPFQEQSHDRRTRRNHSPAFKSKAALAAIRGEHTLAELSRRFDVDPNRIAQWREQLLTGAAGVFGRQRRLAEPPVDMKALYEKIGELTPENDFIRRAHQDGISERKAMIDRTHPLPLSRQAAAAGTSRGSGYYPPEPVCEADLALIRRINELRLELAFARNRMLRDLPNGQGLAVGRKHVATPMRRMEIQAIAISMERNDCWRDNVFIERLWKSVKYEDIYPRVYETIGHAKQSLGLYLDSYDTRRPYSTLDRKAPDKVYYASPPLPKAA